MAKALTPRQEAFCLAYVGCLNAAQAAREAGYSMRTAKKQGSRLLTNVDLSNRIEQLKAMRFEKAAMDTEEVLHELTWLARTDMADYLKVEKDGRVILRPLNQLPAGASRCIRNIRHKTTRRGNGIEETVTEVALWDKLSALEILARHRGLFEHGAEDTQRPAAINITFTQAKPPVGWEPRKP
jgi:phage terminase small subunit